MADLDDFFAKKDRKKSKSAPSKKFATPEELAKRIEESAKKAAEASKAARKVTPAPVAVAVAGAGGAEGGAEQQKSSAPEPVEEEWKEFEEERKDYSGLKLAQLNITEGGDGDREDGESGDRKSGAWRKMDGSSEGAKQQQHQQLAQQEPRAASSVYVSPAMKNLRLKGKKGAPDLKNEEFFPTLGAEVPDPTKSRKDSTFEEVKHGGRVRASDLPSAQPLSVGNRFTSLSNDAS
uniref:Uncharacterized protein n=1 Tax=Psorophora albipes TaxID=869069 RepID=T1DIK0_9DIPT